MPPAIVLCPCGVHFRPPSGFPAQVRCARCIHAFALGLGEFTPPPAPDRIQVWPTPAGICARPACRKPFDGAPNQRYCSPACRFTAAEERHALWVKRTKRPGTS